MINRSYRTGTESDTAIDSGIGIMTEDDCVFFLCCDGRLFVGIADNHRIFYTFRLAIIPKENRILGIGDGIIGTDGIQMESAIDGIIKTINHIVHGNIIFCTGYCIFDTKNLCFLRIICRIATADDKSSTATFTLFNSFH